jgi:GNAT superfamily N-acetyltransferase
MTWIKSDYGFNVRHATVADAHAIVEANATMAVETEGRALDRATLERGVAGLFADPARGFYLVAEDETGTVAGQLLVTYEWSDWRDGVIFWIQSVHVGERYRRRGVYRLLHHAVEQLARAQGDPRVVGIRLYVDQNNHAAMAVYRALGMDQAHYHVYETDFVLGTHTGAHSPERPAG